MTLRTLGASTTSLDQRYVGGNVLALGVKGDVVTVTDAAITSGQATLSSASAAFTTADVGKVVQVVGAGAAFNNRGAWAASTAYVFGDRVSYLGGTYYATASFTSGTAFDIGNWMAEPATSQTLMATISSVTGGVATLSASASTTVSGATCTYGTDDSPVITALPSGNYYFPGGRTYFLADWFVPSNLKVTFGPGAVFKIPSYTSTDVSVFRLLTSNRSSTGFVDDVHFYGRPRIDMTELTPPSTTQPKGMHVMNCRGFTVEKLFGRAIPGGTGNLLHVAANSAGTAPTRGVVGSLYADQTRGLGSSAVQHTGGTDIDYGVVVADGGVAFRVELDGNALSTEGVTCRQAHVTNDSAFATAAGGADGLRYGYTTTGSVTDCTVNSGRVTGGGRAVTSSTNGLSTPGVTIKDVHGDGAVAAPSLRSVAGSLGAVAFQVAPGMTLVNCRATNGADVGFKDLFASSIVSGSRVTLVNCEASDNTGPGAYFRATEKVVIHGGNLYDSRAALTPLTAQLLPSNAYTGTLAGWSTATNGTPSGAGGVLTLTIAASSGTTGTVRTATGTSGFAVVAGHFYKVSATAAVGTAPAGAFVNATLWWYTAAGAFISLSSPTAIAPGTGATVAVAAVAPATAAFAAIVFTGASDVNGGTVTAGWTYTFSSIAVSELSALPTQTYGIQADAGVTVARVDVNLLTNLNGKTTGAGTFTDYADLLPTVAGGLIVGGTGGTPTRLTGTTGQVPTWQADGSITPATPAAGVTLDATTGDIVPITAAGVAAAGATGKAADAGHVHALLANIWTPARNNLLSASFNPLLAGSQRATGTGQPFYVKIPWETTATIANVLMGLKTLGTTLTAGDNFVALYSVSGTNMTLIAQTADQAAVWATPGTTGNKTMALTAVSGQSLTNVPGGAGKFLVAGILAVGTTPPTWYANTASAATIPDITVIGMAASDGYTAFQISGQTGLTAPPAGPFSFASATAQGIVPFVGLS